MDYKLLLISSCILLIAFNVDANSATSKFVTKTVYGFLDFTTTIGNTVMIFSPESSPTLDMMENKIEPLKVIETKPIKTDGKSSEGHITPTKLLLNNTSKNENERLQVVKKSSIFISNQSKFFKSVSSDLPGVIINTTAYTESNIYTPEYDLLSRQPTEYIEESYKLVNINASSRNHKFRNFNSRLCSKGNGNDACATSKYSHISDGASKIAKSIKAKFATSVSPRILKTASPSLAAINPEEIIISSSFNSHRKLGSSKRFRTRNFSQVVETTIASRSPVETSRISEAKGKKTSHRSKSKRRNKHSRSNEIEKRAKISTTIEGGRELGRDRSQTHRPKIYTSSSIEVDGSSSSIYTFKLNRTPGRWQYRTSPKPKINIRKAGIGNNSTMSVDSALFLSDSEGTHNIPDAILSNVSLDLEPSGSQNGAVVNNAESEDNQKFLVQTLNIEISTLPDFQSKYYEIVTIKTPYTFQAGVIKKTRYITVTSTLQKSLEPETSASEIFEGPLTENILTVSSKDESLKLEGSITTLAPIYLTRGEETPSLEVTTESYTLTQKELETKVLPIVRDGENATSYITAIHTYDVQNLITVTKTLLPHDINQFNPSKNLKDFTVNLDAAGSEINFDLDFADEDPKEENAKDYHFSSTSSIPTSSSATPDLQQLALLNMFRPISQIPALATRPIVKVKTLWQSHVIPIVSGYSTYYRTISKSVGTIDTTEYAVDTISLPPSAEANSFLLQDPRQFQTITSPWLQQTIVTETSSKILKLTFGAKTTYTTLFSTNVVPKVITTFITTSFPLQPTVAFPGYFPPAYPHFPYIG